MNSLVRKIIIFVTVMAIVAAAGWYGRKAYKHSAENRLLKQAEQYIEKKDWRNGALCLQRVLQINPMSVEGSRKMADLIESAGGPGALDWRIRTAKLEPGNPTNHILWAQAALKANNAAAAAEALEGMSEKSKTSAPYHKTAGALAWSLGKPLEAEQHYVEALRLEPTNPAVALNLATIRLASTNKAAADLARKTLEQLSTRDDMRLPALRLLLSDAVVAKSMPTAIARSKAIVDDSESTFGDKVGHLQLLHQAHNADEASCLATLKKAAAQSSADAFALGRWMAIAQSPSDALAWLQTLSPSIQTNQPTPLIITDCQIAKKDWQGLLAFTEKQDWTEAEFYRLSLESLANRSLNHTAAADTAWRKSLRLAAHRTDRLTRLSQVAGAWNWTAERTDILEQITTEFPKEKWAVNQLMTQLYADGNTSELQQMLSRIYTADPSDIRLKNNLANVFLLRKSELDQAYKMAREVYEASPEDPFFTSTYAYSLVLQNKQDEALKVIAKLKQEYLTIPSVAAYYGVIQAMSGNKDIARESLVRAETAKLLPEEREMVRIAKARL